MTLLNCLFLWNYSCIILTWDFWSWSLKGLKSISFSFVESMLFHAVSILDADEESLALRLTWLSCLVVGFRGIGFSFLLLFGIAGGLSGIGGGATYMYAKNKAIYIFSSFIDSKIHIKEIYFLQTLLFKKKVFWSLL